MNRAGSSCYLMERARKQRRWLLSGLATAPLWTVPFIKRASAAEFVFTAGYVSDQSPRFNLPP